ncbi:MAG: NAD(P)H-dependent oxidoreductase subunit E [Myxococcota bacterium]|jgi:NADH-quinone oxidoreductase subunit E|nr:NAD(P)H-dependent oxidoreductase subunit E [Myxococcota bacterium]
MEISEKLRREIAAQNATFPRLRSGLMPALHRVYQACGEINAGAVAELAEIFEMTPDEVRSVVELSNALDSPRRGRHQVKVCVGGTCLRDGAREFLGALSCRIGVPVGEISEDGRIELGEEVCFGACAAAPLMWVGDDMHDDVGLDDAERILAALE